MTVERTSGAKIWHGGPFNPEIHPLIDLPPEEVSQARSMLQEFISDSHRYYIGYSIAIMGFKAQRERYEGIMDPAHRDNTFSVGSQFPNAHQSPGGSTTAAMTQGQLLDGLQDGGAFEVQQCKALIVLIYHLWDELYRPSIAELISVCPKRVQCDLMGDVRLVRNVIIHEKSIAPKGFSTRLKSLPHIWDISPGELHITYQMINSFKEQLNAIQLTIVECCPDPECSTCKK